MKDPSKAWEYLQLSEVQMVTPTGLLVGRDQLTFTMSSSYDDNSGASNCNDGGIDWPFCVSAGASVDPSPWLSITYPCSTPVGSVMVYNRPTSGSRIQSYLIQQLESGLIKWQSGFTSNQPIYTFTAVAASTCLNAKSHSMSDSMSDSMCV